MWRPAPVAGPSNVGSSSSPNIGHPRPQPLPPLVRVDTQAIKQELHDALGENGLAYWKAVNGYLVAQLSKRELEGMVRGWLKGDKLLLHNKLLISLLHNASTPSQAPSAQIARKRKRVQAHDPEFDIDESLIEPKMRISQWIGSMTNRDRGRLRRAMNIGVKAAEEEEAAAIAAAAAGGGDGVEGVEGDSKVDDPESARRKLSTYTPNIALPSISLPDRTLPSSLQIAARLKAFATANDLPHPAPSDETAEFLSVGLDAHISEILHSIVHLTGRNRPGTESIQIPPQKSSTNTKEDTEERDESKPALPQPSVEILHHLVNLNPGIHPHPSPVLNQLRTGHTLGQIHAHKPKFRLGGIQNPTPSRPHSPSIPSPFIPNGHTAKPSITELPIPPQPKRKARPPTLNHHLIRSPPSSPSRPIVPLSNPNSSHMMGSLGSIPSGSTFISHRAEAVGRNLLESGLLKIEVPDKGEEEKEGKGKKKKHGLHWKYEDPAFILRDILG